MGHIQEFLLELERGFSFVSRQKKIDVDGDNFYIDLVFYIFRDFFLKIYIDSPFRDSIYCYNRIDKIQIIIKRKVSDKMYHPRLENTMKWENTMVIFYINPVLIYHP